MKIRHYCLLICTAMVCITTTPILASSAELKGYISALSEKFDNGLQYRVVLEKGFKYAPGTHNVTENYFQTLISRGSFACRSGFSLSVVEIIPKYEIELPYLVDLFVQNNKLKILRKRQLKSDDYTAYQVDTEKDGNTVLFSGFRNGKRFFLLIGEVPAGASSKAQKSARIAFESFELTSYEQEKYIEPMAPITVGDTGVDSIVPNSWAVQEIKQAPEGAGASRAVLDEEGTTASIIQIKTAMKSAFPGITSDGMFSSIKREVVGQGYTILQNISRADIKSDQYKGVIENHTLKAEDGTLHYLVVAVLEGKDKWISISGVSLMNTTHPILWSRLNTAFNILLQNLETNN